MKTCIRCQTGKPPAEFHRDRSRPDGRSPYCRPCGLEMKRASRQRARRTAAARAAAALARAGHGDVVTLQEAVAQGVVPWLYEAARKRLQRAAGGRPAAVGRRGRADLYDRAELVAWARGQRLAPTASELGPGRR